MLMPASGWPKLPRYQHMQHQAEAHLLWVRML